MCPRCHGARSSPADLFTRASARVVHRLRAGLTLTPAVVRNCYGFVIISRRGGSARGSASVLIELVRRLPTVRPGVLVREAVPEDLAGLVQLCLEAREESAVGAQLCSNDADRLRH